jgi:transposase
MLHAIVHPADVQDRDGGVLVLKTLFGLHPFLKKLFADGGYQGRNFREAQKRALPNMTTEIVKRSDQAKGFQVLPRRWVVERTLAWLGRCRRLAKDWENLNRKALAFLRLASIRFMLRKLCNPCYSFSWRIALLERFWQARYAAYLISSSPSFPLSSPLEGPPTKSSPLQPEGTRRSIQSTSLPGLIVWLSDVRSVYISTHAQYECKTAVS